MTIGDLIREQRKKKHMTIESLSEICGVPKSTISRWENVIIKKISRDKQEKLCIALDIDPVVFFYKEEILSREEMRIIIAFREADERAREDALKMLLEHKKTNVTASMVG